jgi:hypothetical protein
MGISKIFKDKPKDEDAALPEKQGILGFKKKSGKKSEASPAAVSHAYAELDRDLNRLSEEDDRILSGLSPAAALARQHTVKSRAEQAKRDAEKKAALERETTRQRQLDAAEMGGHTGVSTWDSNTTTRANQPTYAAAAADAASVPMGPTNVVTVTPRSPNVVHHAFAVNQPDYDSDDSSEGDTIENIASDLRHASLSDPADRDFEALWGKASIDPNARPKKGILKICQSNEDLEKLASQQQQQKAQSAPTTPPAHPEAHAGGPLDLASPNPERIDGNAHAPHAEEPKFDIDFSSFDTSPDLDLKPPVIYKNPVHNSSAPGISRGEGVEPHARAMSAPSRRRLVWAPECAVYSTYDALTPHTRVGNGDQAGAERLQTRDARPPVVEDIHALLCMIHSHCFKYRQRIQNPQGFSNTGPPPAPIHPLVSGRSWRLATSHLNTMCTRFGFSSHFLSSALPLSHVVCLQAAASTYLPRTRIYTLVH